MTKYPLNGKKRTLMLVLAVALTASACALLSPTASPMPSTQETPAAQTIAPCPASPIGIPEGFIVNAANATDDEIAAVFEAEKSLYPSVIENPGEVKLYIYARQAWHGGALLLAGTAQSDFLAPELYFVQNGSVVMHTTDSDVWSINYTHYAGETIVFAKYASTDLEAQQHDALKAIAKFWNGETASTRFELIKNDTLTMGGILCAVPSTTWLSSLELTSADKTIADGTNETVLYSPDNQPWYGEPESIRNRTRYAHAADFDPSAKAGTAEALGGYPFIAINAAGLDPSGGRAVVLSVIEAVNRADVERYIGLFDSLNNRDMRAHVENNGTDSFFQEQETRLLDMKVLSYDTGILAAGVTIDELERYEAITVYYVKEQITAKPLSGGLKSGVREAVYVLGKENGALKVLRISSPNSSAIDAAGEGFSQEGPAFISPLTPWGNCAAHGGVPVDIWHGNNGLNTLIEVPAGSVIHAELWSEPKGAEGAQRVCDLPVSKVYWVDLSVKDDAACMREGALVCPMEKGFYTLVLLTEHGYLSQMIRVV